MAQNSAKTGVPHIAQVMSMQRSGENIYKTV